MWFLFYQSLAGMRLPLNSHACFYCLKGELKGNGKRATAAVMQIFLYAILPFAFTFAA